jgi:hypothetical protein
MTVRRALFHLSLALAIAVTTLAIVPLPSAVEGQGRLRAQIWIVQQRIPRGLTERGLIGFARRANARRMRETTAEPIAERKWVGEMVTSFNRAPGDLEFHVLFYDVEDGARRFITDMSTFVNDRSQRTFVQRLNLERGSTRHDGFQPNHRMELVVTVRRQEVGRLNFELLGEEIRRTGQVDFSDEEAR